MSENFCFPASGVKSARLFISACKGDVIKLENYLLFSSKIALNQSFGFICLKFKVDCETDAKNCFTDNSKWLLSRSNFFVDGRKISKFQAGKPKTQILSYPFDALFDDNNPVDNFFGSRLNTLVRLAIDFNGKLHSIGSGQLDCERFKSSLTLLLLGLP